MARKHRLEAPDDGRLVLPRELAAAVASRALSEARSDWFRARGIDPGDWSEVYPVLRRSWSAYGLEYDALSRARRRAEGR